MYKQCVLLLECIRLLHTSLRAVQYLRSHASCTLVSSAIGVLQPDAPTHGITNASKQKMLPSL